MKFKAPFSVILSGALTFIPVVRAAQPTSNSNGNGNGNSNGGNGSSNTGTGNSGNGVGNTGPGNQGNTTTNGNAGGTTGSSTGSTTGSSNTGTGNSGNGVGNTGPGNQGNSSSNGNAGGTTGSSTSGSNGGNNGSSTNGGNNGSSTNGGNNGSSTNGGNNGSSTNGGNNGSSTNGGNNGSSTNGGNNGSSTNGGNNGSSTTGGLTGGSTAGGSTTGGQTTSGSTSGGSTTSGTTSGGETTGSTTGGLTGDSTVGGSTTGGQATSGSTEGGTTSGTATTGGSTAAGSTSGGETTSGSTAGGSTSGGETTSGSTSGGETTSGSTTGGSTGETTGGSTGETTGGSIGETTGGSTGNTTGGSTGETTGGSTGETTGGSTGETAGGSTGDTTGGSTGETTGGSTGDTTGGSTGDTTGGSTGETTGGSTGETTGGSTGETDGGTTGETDGGTTGETDGGSEGENPDDDGEDNTTPGDEDGEDDDGKDNDDKPTEPVEETKPEKDQPKIKVRVLPLVFGSYDIQKKIINLTVGELQDSTSILDLDNFRDGFKVSLMKSYEAGLGVAGQVYVDNATGLMAASSGIIGLAVTKNRLVQFERLVTSKNEAYNLKTLPIPFKADVLSSYKIGESVYFENMGGLLFLGGANVGIAYAGGSVVAEGGFRTLITKTANDKVTVQLVKANLRKATLYTGVGVYRLESASNKQLNQGFSYTFNLNSKESVDAYERLLTGNAVPAQALSSKPFTGVEMVESFTGFSNQRSKNVAFGIPMVFMYNWSTGKTYGQTDTIYHADNSKTELHYGVYFKELNGRFFHDHKKLVRSFYSGKALNKSMNNEVRSEDQVATYLWSYENDSSRTHTFTKALKTFQKDLGLRAEFNPTVGTREYLGYMKLQAELIIPASYTQRLMELQTVNRLGAIDKEVSALINHYFSKGDLDNICQNDDGDVQSGLDLCKENLVYDTIYSVGKIKNLLSQMSMTNKAAEFVSLHALVGKEIVRNQFILTSLFTLDTNCEVNFNVKLEGERFSQTFKTIPANPDCR
jgi:hypothetical protein